jgi:tRNA dimethylallyltransferase
MKGSTGHSPDERAVPVRGLFLSGATASGKTALAVSVAAELGAEIVSCDSRQIFRGMEIGTAAPTPDERARVPHHLVGVADPTESWSAGRWARAATLHLEAIGRRGGTALIVGGSGLYARALRRGLAELPASPAVRARLDREWEEEGGEALHARLRRLDPEAAEGIHPHNRHRLLRALEVALATGRPISAHWASAREAPPLFPAPLVALDVPRAALYERIDRRVEAMFAGGLLDEARRLLAAGFSPACRAYRTLGYPEALACVEGTLSPREAIMRVQQRTRAFARRQLTWLRGESEVRWLPSDPARPAETLSALRGIVAELSETDLMPLDAPSRSG